MSRFKVGQTVYFGDECRKLTVKRVVDNALLPVYQYGFEEVGFICGEQSLKAHPDDPKLSISDCFKDQYEDDVITQYNTTANGMGVSIDGNEIDYSGFTSLFFKPDLIFVKWLVKYANGRQIIDVGAGQGHLVRLIKRMGGNAIGFEPNLDYRRVVTMRMQKDSNYDVNEILPFRIQDHPKMVQSLGDKALLIFARPSHSNFVVEGLDIMPEGMEALYITLPENLEKYDDLGHYEDSAVLLEHQGISEDNEIVYSIKK